MRATLLRISLVGATLCAACDGSSESSSTASCAGTVTFGDIMTRTCDEWTGLSSDEFITIRTLCTRADAGPGSPDASFTSTAEFRAGLCDRGAVGGCLMGGTGFGRSMTTWYYATASITRESAQDICRMYGGTFVEP